jgi:hypothetical protein
MHSINDFKNLTLQVLAQSGYVVNSKLLSKPHELNALIKLFNDAQSKGITNFDDLPDHLESSLFYLASFDQKTWEFARSYIAAKLLSDEHLSQVTRQFACSIISGWDPVKSINMSTARETGKHEEFAPIIEQLGLTLINVFQLPVTGANSENSFGASEVISLALCELGVSIDAVTVCRLLSAH